MIANHTWSRATHVAGWFAVVISLSLVAPVLLPGVAGAASVEVGKVSITAPNGSAITGGGSHTIFSVSPPAGAKCPGDTAHDFYFVSSYLVRKGVSPTAVNFRRGGRPSQGFGLISDGRYYGAVNTALDTGVIVTLPSHAVWDRLTTKMLFPKGEKSSTWETGIACGDTNGVVRRYWNAELKFTPSTTDSLGFEWTILDAGAAAAQSKSDNHTGLIAVILVVGTAAIGLLVLNARRTRDRAGAQR